MKKNYFCNIETRKTNAMKKLLFPIALLLMTMVGCKCTRNNSNEVEVEAYTLADSVLIESDLGDEYSYYMVNADLPVTTNNELKESIINWMLDGEDVDLRTYFEDKRDNFFAEEGDEPGSILKSNYTLVEQTDVYVTYLSEGMVFTGGAHPMPWYYGTSFSKADGSIIGYDIFDDPEQLVGLVTEALRKQYFEPTNTIEEEYIIEPGDTFDLPTNLPWIEADSMVFCYQPLEIEPYSAGMPLCKIALTDLKPYFSELGNELFDNE